MKPTGAARLLTVAVLVAACLAARPAGGAPAPDELSGCGQGSWTAGTVDLCAGELVYRDYVYDDHGATLLDAISGRLEGLYSYRPTGDGWGDIGTAGMADQFAPAGTIPQPRDNLADLVALRLRTVDDDLVVSAELNTMFQPDQAIVVVGIDTDGDPSTSASPTWPEGVLASPFLLPGHQALRNRGNDTFVTLRAGEPTTNLLSATARRPPGDRWRLQAITARPVPGAAGPVVMNVAFRGPDERGGWWDTAQALALASNDISTMAEAVEVADLDERVTRPAVVEPGLVRQRVYVSEHNPGTGEGIDHAGVPGPDGDHAFTMLGRYQPYGFYQPAGDGPFGLQLTLHGLGENHAFLLTDPAGGRNPTNYAVRMGLANDRILASPLARGPRGWYSSYAERDVLDVFADVRAHHPVDDERVVLSGLSMGGYGTMRLASLHPDRFAAAIEWVGPTGRSNAELVASAGSDAHGQRADVLDLLGNLRNLPIAALYHGTDQLVHVDQAVAVRDRLAALQVPSVHWLHPVGPHSSDANFDDWTKESAWSAGRIRVTNPARVTFRTDERFIVPELGLAPDGAYWVDHVVPAGPGYADVDATSHACAPEPVMATTTEVGNGPSPWLAQRIEPAGAMARPPANRLDVVTTNVASLAIDTDQACLVPGELTLHLTSDRPVTVTLSDGRTVAAPAGSQVHVLPADVASNPASPVAGAVGTAGDGGAAALASFEPSSAGPGLARSSELPRTGSDQPPVLALMLLSAAMAARRGRRRRHEHGRQR